MGRGRAKAKQTKVARELKYGGPQTDFDRLQAELGNGGGASVPATEPLDASCPCHVCTTYTRSYLRHLVAVGEMSGLRFLSYHNTFFLTRLIQQARAAILGGSFVQWRDATLAQYRGQA